MEMIRPSIRDVAEALVWQCLEWSPYDMLDAVDWARRAIDPYRERGLTATRIVGRGKSNGRAILLVGRGSDLEGFAISFCGEDRQAISTNAIAAADVIAQIPSLSKNVDLVISRVARHYGDAIPDRFALRSPCLVRSIIKLPLDPVTRRNVKVSQSDNLRRIRKSELSWTIGDKSEDLESFYNHFYKPYKNWRFGRDATDVSLHRLRYLYRRNGRIFWIIRDGRPIAGNLLLTRNSVLQMSISGVLDGEFEHVRAGALGAGYHFVQSWAENQGFEQIDLGFSRCCLNDGILLTKRRWGGMLDPRGISRFEYVTYWADCTPQVIWFLNNNPLIFQDSTGFSGLTALSGDEPHTIDDVLNAARRHWIDGLERLIIMTHSCRDIMARIARTTSNNRIWITGPGKPAECISQAVPMVAS